MSRTPLAALLCLAAAPALAAERGTCGTTTHGAHGAVAENVERGLRVGAQVRSASVASGVGREGNIAIVLDEGDLAKPRNPVDLQSMGLRFTPEGSGYVVSRVDQPLLPATGQRVGLGDDDTVAMTLPFAFPFYGQSRSDAFLNSDGNITFGAGDNASTSRDLSRLLGGAPRVAGFLADMDVTAGGSITWEATAARATATWTDVPRWNEGDRNTFQISLYPDGRIEFVYGSNLARDVDEGVVGLAPGADQGGFTPVDMSTAAAVVAPGALAESFREDQGLDTVAVARKFYREFRDDYDQLVVFTTQKLTSGNTFAFEQTVKNNTGGLGFNQFDESAGYGSGGRLESFVLMDDINKYPADPRQRFLGENNTLTLLGQESGHRWLTQVTFRDDQGRTSSALLGRDDVHWSFFFDSDGSDVEGSDIEDLGGGNFRTGTALQGYSALDQYLMGLRPAEEVPPFFYVQGVDGTTFQPGSAPRTGITFRGTRKDVTIGDVVASIGPRVPGSADAPKTWRQAWILVAGPGGATPEQIAKLEAMRAAWEPYWSQATGGRGTLEARLD